MKRALLAIALLAGCPQTPDLPPTLKDPIDPTPAVDAAEQARASLALGLARLHTSDHDEATTAFTELEALAPDDGVAAYNLALTRYRAADLAGARAALGRIENSEDARVRAGVARLQARLAYEDGDATAEKVALGRALKEDPADLGAAWALIRATRDRAERRELLLQARAQAPDNAPIAAEYGLMAAEADGAEREAGLAALKELLPLTEDRRAAEMLASGTPAGLRGFVNLVRASARYRAQGEELEKKLAPAPVTSLEAWRFRTRTALTDLALATASLPLAKGAIDATWLGDAGDGDGAVRPPRLVVLSDTGVIIEGGDGGNESFPATGTMVRAADLDVDSASELLVLGPGGVTVYDRGRNDNWAETAFEGADLRWMLPVDLDHDADADLLVGDAAGAIRLMRNAEGLQAIGDAGLPDVGPVRTAAALDIDGDRDVDLLLGGDASVSVLLNDRLGNWSVAATLALPGAATTIEAIDHRGEGVLGAVVATEAGLVVLRGGPEPAIDPAATGTLSDVRSTADVAVTDLDLDGDPDLAIAGDAGLTLAENLGGGLFRLDGGVTDERMPATTGLLVGALAGDEAPDLLTWGEAPIALTNGAAAPRAWLDLDLRAPPTKAPSDAQGVRIDVVRGGRTQSFQATGPHVRLSGAQRPDFVTATWPNGITEYLFAPEPKQLHRIELVVVLEGSCPFLYVHDGERFRFVTDLLGVSPLGLQLAPGVFAPADPDEYLRLPDWTMDDGTVRLRYTEELHEVTYLDGLQLVVVDAPKDLVAHSAEKWIMPPIEGFDLRFTGPLVAPAGARDADGNDVLAAVLAEDDVYVAPKDTHPRYQGTGRAVLELDVPPEIAASERPVLWLNGWLHWGNTSTNIALSQAFRPQFPTLEVGDGAGGWNVIPEFSPGLPAGKTKPVLVELAGRLNPEDPRLRIAGDFAVAWDIAAFGVRADDVEHTVTRLDAATATLQFGGFSKMTKANADAPHAFDYSVRKPWPWRTSSQGVELPVSWQELEGPRTPFGDVRPLLTTVDDRMVIFGDGEEIDVVFDTSGLPPLPADRQRTLFLFNHGWAKDGDPNVASAQTVLPLPFNAMPAYPATGPYPPELAGFAQSLTRVVDKDRLAERITEAASAP